MAMGANRNTDSSIDGNRNGMGLDDQAVVQVSRQIDRGPAVQASEQRAVRAEERDMSRYLDLFLEMGKSMMEAGAEVHRVEDTIYRLCAAYGMREIEIFAIRSLIVLSVKDGKGKLYNNSKRIYEVGIHMGKLEEFNQASRLICAQLPELEEITSLLEKCRRTRSVTRKETLFGYMLAAFSFACFFGGRLRDGAAGAVLGMLLFIMDQKLAKRCPQRLIYIVLVSVVLGFCGEFWGYLGLGFRPDKIMIGTIMLLIPGMAFMNSMRDMLSNNEINGLFSCLDVLLTAGAIAVGFAVPLLLLGEM